MRPSVRSIYTASHEDIESFQPQDPINFETVIRMMIGPEGEPGEESFDLLVCTPEHLKDECEQTGYCFACRRLVVSHWNPDLIKKFISARIATITADSWQSLAAKLTDFSHWEFEDYRETPKP